MLTKRGLCTPEEDYPCEQNKNSGCRSPRSQVGTMLSPIRAVDFAFSRLEQRCDVVNALHGEGNTVPRILCGPFTHEKGSVCPKLANRRNRNVWDWRPWGKNIFS